VHALQIEIARRLYMDETLIERSAGFPRIEQAITTLVGSITQQARELIG